MRYEAPTAKHEFVATQPRALMDVPFVSGDVKAAAADCTPLVNVTSTTSFAVFGKSLETLTSTWQVEPRRHDTRGRSGPHVE